MQIKNRNTLLCALISMSTVQVAHAQLSYTYFPTNTTINYAVTTDFSIVGFSGGGYNENDFSREFTGPSSPTVQVAAGTDILNELDLFNHSVVNFDGGSSGAVIPQQESTLNVHGGHLGFTLNFEEAMINLHGGRVDDLEGQGKGINVFGGSVGSIVANSSSAWDGTSLGSCIVNVHGGAFDASMNAYNDGILNLYGEDSQGGLLRARYGGTINIFGSNLTATLVDSNYSGWGSLYSLSGLLANGFDLTGKQIAVENDGVTYGHSSFHLNSVPEPSAIASLGLMAIGFLWRRGRPHN